MNITVSIHELVSWFITIVAVTLFIIERRKNVGIPYYMALQGILRACHEKFIHYYYLIHVTNEEEGNNNISKSQYLLVLRSIATDYRSIMHQIMGTMKAIEPMRDMPFDIETFTRPDQLKKENLSDRS